MHICSISEDGNYYTDRLRISTSDFDEQYFKKPSIYILRIFFMSDVNSKNTGIHLQHSIAELFIENKYMGIFLNKLKLDNII